MHNLTINYIVSLVYLPLKLGLLIFYTAYKFDTKLYSKLRFSVIRFRTNQVNPIRHD
jgi:hypothetical protein